MAVLDRLCIRGIRSFGPEDEEKLKFSTPVTLLLGQNGCGKTTIIESIKYALTGDLPSGTDSGRGFVNDPKLSNKNSTKGYIKLKFKDCKGDSIIVGKFVEVAVQGGGKLRFKTLTPAIRTEDAAGNIHDIAGRCADTDLYCAQKLNVSKAIINNVIFCHQENSGWPLDEGKKLKEKFDEIFEATEYNRSVDRLRKLIKDKGNNRAVLRAQLEQKRIIKTHVENLSEKLHVSEAQLEKILNNIADKNKEIEPLETRLNEINDLVNELGKLQQQIFGLEKILEEATQNQNALKKHLTEEFEGTDEELNIAISNFGENQGKIEKSVTEMEEKNKKIELALAEISKQQQNLQVTLGQLKEEEKQHTKRCEELRELIEKTKVKLAVEADENDPPTEVLEKLKAAFKEEESQFQQLRREQENEEQNLQKSIDDVRIKYAQTKENLNSKEQTLSSTNKTIEEIQGKFQQMQHSISHLKIIEKKVKEVEDNLSKKKEEFNEAEEQLQLEELDNQINNKERLQNKLDSEYRILNQNYGIQQNIERETNLNMEKKAELEALKHKHKENFKTLFGERIPQEKFEPAVKTIQKREEEKIKKLNQAIGDYEKKVTKLEATIKHTEDKLQTAKKELQTDQKKIENLCHKRPYADILNQSYTKKEKLQKDKGTYRSAKTLFEEFINQFEQEAPCCPVCETNFTGKKSVVSNIIGRLKGKIEELPRKLTDIETDLKKEEDFYNKLQQLKPISNNIEVLIDAKIPLLEEELQQHLEKLTETKMELASLKNDLQEPQKLSETCRKVISDATLLDRITQDVTKSEIAIESLKSDLAQVASNRTLEQTEAELNKLKNELVSLRNQHRTKRNAYEETKDYIHRLNGKLQGETQKKMELMDRIREEPLLKKKMEECKQSVVQLQKDKEDLIMNVAMLQDELRQAENTKNQAVKRNHKLLEEKHSTLDQHRRLIDDIHKLNTIIEKFKHGGSKTKQEGVMKKLEEHKANTTKMENAKKLLSDKILEKKNELASQKSKLRELKDNVELRNSKKKAVELQKQMGSLKEKLGNHNHKTVLDEKRKIIERIDSKRHDVSEQTGKMKSLEQTIKELKHDLAKKEHKEAFSEYKKKYYEIRLEELAVDDLTMYAQALEHSILKFHKEKMIQINMTIRELWRSIYKGNDIDYIEIKTDEDSITGSGANRRRTYSYRVIQVKKGVELEMRGRCSAGQRVLACLVIRMALADTFSANCGILALDEPTTNLDRENVMSLCDALSKIISAREKQKNFQLVVITHDEEFVQALTTDQTVSHFWRVQRNRDGFSEIKKEIL